MAYCIHCSHLTSFSSHSVRCQQPLALKSSLGVELFMWAGALECRSSFTKAKLILFHLQRIRLRMNTTSTLPCNSHFSLRQATTFTELTDLQFSTEEGWKGWCTTTDKAQDIWKTLSCPSPALLGDCLTAHLSRATQCRSKQSLFISEWDSTSIFHILVWDETHRADACFHSASGLETNTWGFYRLLAPKQLINVTAGLRVVSNPTSTELVILWCCLRKT